MNRRVSWPATCVWSCVSDGVVRLWSSCCWLFFLMVTIFLVLSGDLVSWAFSLSLFSWQTERERVMLWFPGEVSDLINTSEHIQFSRKLVVLSKHFSGITFLHQQIPCINTLSHWLLSVQDQIQDVESNRRD